MTNADKVYKLLLNMLDNKCSVRLVYDIDTGEKYEVKGLELDALNCRITANIFVDSPLLELAESVHIYAINQNDQEASSVGTKNIDSVLNVLENSYIDWIIDGIEY